MTVNEDGQVDAVQSKMDALLRLGSGQAMTTALARPAASMANARNEQIGGLRGNTIITIQTRQAQNLLLGREGIGGRPGVTGLMKFSGYLTQVSSMAAQDDPWADWVLLRVEELLQQAGAGLDEMNQNIQATLKANPLMEIEVSHSIEPLKVNIGFGARHAYWVARVILKVDEVARGVLTLRHQALLNQAHGDKMLDKAAGLVRRVFESTVDYRATGVTRTDVQENNAVAQRAATTLAKLGKLPDDVLAGTRRAEYAPVLQVRRVAVTAPVGMADSKGESGAGVV